MKSKLDEQIRKENIKLHDFGALNYDNYPPYLMRRLDEIFYNDAKFIKKKLGKSPKALDCGCGTGVLAVNLLRKGFDVELLDISREMINAALKKIRKKGFRKKKIGHHVGDVDDFLKKSRKSYDVICFTAVLHHIRDYIATLKLAAAKLNKGGIIYIAEEPQLVGGKKGMRDSALNFMVGQSINAYKLFKNPRHALNFVGQKLFKREKKDRIDLSMAEFHALKGVDEKKIMKMLEGMGFKILKFETYFVHPFGFFELFNVFFKDRPKTFKIIAKKG